MLVRVSAPRWCEVDACWCERMTVVGARREACWCEGRHSSVQGRRVLVRGSTLVGAGRGLLVRAPTLSSAEARGLLLRRSALVVRVDAGRSCPGVMHRDAAPCDSASL